LRNEKKCRGGGEGGVGAGDVVAVEVAAGDVVAVEVVAGDVVDMDV